MFTSKRMLSGLDDADDVSIDELGDEDTKKSDSYRDPDTYSVEKRALKKRRGEFTEVTVKKTIVRKLKIYHEETFDLKPVLTKEEDEKYYDVSFVTQVAPGYITDMSLFEDEGFLDELAKKEGWNHVTEKMITFDDPYLGVVVMPKDKIKPIYKEGTTLNELTAYLRVPLELSNAYKTKKEDKEHPVGCKCHKCNSDSESE
jgi:hypothetical protein